MRRMVFPVLACALSAHANAAVSADQCLEFTALGQSAGLAAAWVPQAFTVEGWFRVDAYTVSSLTTGAGLVTLGGGGTQNFSLWAISSVGDPTHWRPYLQINYANNQPSRSLGPVELLDAPQGWRHIAATYDGVTARVLLDGDVVAEEVWNTPIGTGGGTALRIGQEFPGVSEFLDGAVDELRIWEIAREPTDIARDMDAQLCGDEPGLWAYYRFDTGGLYLDSSANGRNLTGSGSPAQSGAPDLDACVVCVADVNTTNTNPGDAGYGEPDGTVDGADLSYFVENWLGQVAAVADVNTTNTNPGDAGYGEPDGVVNGADLSYFVENWLAGCP